MKPCPVYPLHDKDGYLEFATGMWLHTAHIVGKPTEIEVRITLAAFPATRQQQVTDWLRAHDQLAPVNWAERIAA